jgi:hypothetical protein
MNEAAEKTRFVAELEAHLVALDPVWPTRPESYRNAVIEGLCQARLPSPEEAERLARILRPTPLWKWIVGEVASEGVEPSPVRTELD